MPSANAPRSVAALLKRTGGLESGPSDDGARRLPRAPGKIGRVLVCAVSPAWKPTSSPDVARRLWHDPGVAHSGAQLGVAAEFSLLRDGSAFALARKAETSSCRDYQLSDAAGARAARARVIDFRRVEPLREKRMASISPHTRPLREGCQRIRHRPAPIMPCRVGSLANPASSRNRLDKLFVARLDDACCKTVPPACALRAVLLAKHLGGSVLSADPLRQAGSVAGCF